MKLLSLFTVFFSISSVVARAYLDESIGLSCAFMKTGKKPTYIEVFIQKLTGTDEKAKFPVFILHYPDLGHVTHIPNIQNYAEIFRNNKEEQWDLINHEDDDDTQANTFIAGFDKGYKEKTLNKPLVFEEDPIHFNIEEDGYYCIYIAQPPEVNSFEARINYAQSYGNLDYISYLIYSNLFFILLMFVAVFVYLVHYILKYKLGKDFSNLNKISIISKVTIFYVLLPYIILFTLQWLVYFIHNNFVPTSSNDFFVRILDLVLFWLQHTFALIVNYMILVFAMGFGTIYYFQGNSRNYREFPTKLHQFSKYLFVSNFIALTLAIVIDRSSIDPSIVQDQTAGVLPIWAMVLGLFQTVWFVTSIVYYFKTKKIIAKFPPIATSVDDASELNQKIVNSFRKSVLIIFILPIVLAIISGAIYGVQAVHSLEQYQDIPLNDPSGDGISILQAVSLEQGFMNSSMGLMIWSQMLSILLPIIGVYAIWIRENAGLIIDEGSDIFQYSTVGEFIISDEEVEETEPSEENQDQGKNNASNKYENGNDSSAAGTDDGAPPPGYSESTGK